jgi:hypothetical protein
MAQGRNDVSDEASSAGTRYPGEVRAGRARTSCVRRRSAKQPFCDNLHEGTAFAPVSHVARPDATLWLGGSTRGGGRLIRDGAHNSL